MDIRLFLLMIPWLLLIPLFFGFFYIKYNHSSVDTVVFRYRYTCWNHSCCWYLGGFFLSIVTTLLLMRLLNLWILFLYIKCFGFSLLRPKFLLSCGWIDVAWSVDCGIVVISLFCGSFLAEIFIRKKITSTGALWESRVRYISFFHFSPMDLCQK